MPDVVTRYQPQVHWQMLVTGAEIVCLSVIIGASEPERETIAIDRVYADELMARAQVFWSCVETMTPPVVFARRGSAGAARGPAHGGHDRQ